MFASDAIDSEATCPQCRTRWCMLP